MTPDVPEPNQKMCFPWKLCSEGQQIPSLLHCLIDVCHLKWDTSEYFCLPFKALPKCFSSTAPTGIRFLLCCFFLLLPLGPNSSALFNPGKTRKWALLGGGVGFLSPILSACVLLLQLILPAPPEQMERDRSLPGAIRPVLRELAGKGVRNHVNCAWGMQLRGLEREKKT